MSAAIAGFQSIGAYKAQPGSERVYRSARLSES